MRNVGPQQFLEQPQLSPLPELPARGLPDRRARPGTGRRTRGFLREVWQRTTPHTIRALIDARPARYPDKPFLLAAPECAEDGGAALRPDVLTFAELRDDCRALETVFQEAGLQAGDVVSVFMGNGIHTARLLLAAMYSGL